MICDRCGRDATSLTRINLANLKPAAEPAIQYWCQWCVRRKKT